MLKSILLHTLSNHNLVHMLCWFASNLSLYHLAVTLPPITTSPVDGVKLIWFSLQDSLYGPMIADLQSAWNQWLYIYIYVYIYICVCVCVYILVVNSFPYLSIHWNHDKVYLYMTYNPDAARHTGTLICGTVVITLFTRNTEIKKVINPSAATDIGDSHTFKETYT